jgi:hypothetical protein
VWTKKVDRKRPVEVLVPASATLADYPTRLSELLTTLADVEDRPEGEILRDLRNASGVIVLLRAFPEESDDQSVPLLDGIALGTAGLQIVAASARSASAHLAEWSPRLITAYVAAVRVATAEPGSYVIPLVLPDELPYSARGPNAPAGFGRQVRRELERILDQVEVHGSQEEAGVRPDYFGTEEAAIWNALVSLAGVPDLDGIAVELDPAPDPTGETISRRIFRFNAAALTRMSARPAQAMGPEPLPVDRVAARPSIDVVETRKQGVELVGEVIRLERPSIAIRTRLDDRPRTVRIRLTSEADYESAIEAHRQRRTVLCAGELVLRTSSTQLENVYVFEVLP